MAKTWGKDQLGTNGMVGMRRSPPGHAPPPRSGVERGRQCDMGRKLGPFFSAFRLGTCLSCMQVESPGIQVSMLCSIPKRKADIYLISCRLVHGFAWK